MVKARSRWWRLVREHWPGYAAAVAATGLVSASIGILSGHVNIPNLFMLNLVVIVLTARAFGSGPAVLASVAAYVVFDWFFVEPLHSLGGANPAGWLQLGLFLMTAVAIGELAAGQRRRARLAEERERETMVLYDLVRLIGDTDLGQALGAVAERLRLELQLDFVVIELSEESGSPMCVSVGSGAKELSQSRDVTRQVGASGDLLVIPVQSEDRRVGALTVSKPGDSQEFQASHYRLLSTVAAQLGHAVERQRLRREATEAEILRRSDELKSALLNAVSHDLRTPLASIMAAGESLLEEDVRWTAQDLREFGEAIVDEARRLSRLVGNLLDLSRIEAGSFQPRLDWYPVDGLVREVLGRLRPVIAQHSVVSDVEKEIPPVRLDYLAIDQVLSNLVENAAKYSPPGTEIRVSVRLDGQQLRVEVADRGPGIAPEAMPLLFKPFRRLEGPGSRAGGTGLGLAVAKGLVEAHGGRIWAENRPGGGASFIFALPAFPLSDGEVGAKEMAR